MAEIVSYDAIELKLNSSAKLDGIKDAIDALGELKDVTKDGMSGLGNVAENINGFVQSLSSIDSNVANQYKSLAESVSKIARSGNSAKKVMEKMGASVKEATAEVNIDPMKDVADFEPPSSWKDMMSEQDKLLEKFQDLPGFVAEQAQKADWKGVLNEQDEMMGKWQDIATFSETQADRQAQSWKGVFEDQEPLIDKWSESMANLDPKIDTDRIEETKVSITDTNKAWNEFMDSFQKANGAFPETPGQAMDRLIEKAKTLSEIKIEEPQSTLSSAEILPDTDSIVEKSQYIVNALGSLHNHIARDLKIADKHGDSDFKAQIESYAKTISEVEQILANNSNLSTEEYQRSVAEIEPLLRKTVDEYKSISRSGGTAFVSANDSARTATMTLGELKTAISEIRKHGGLEEALRANNARSFFDIAPKVEEQSRKAAEAMDKVAGSTRRAKTEEELFQEEVQAVMAEIEKVNGVSNSYLRNVLHFNPEAIYEARYQLTAMKEAAKEAERYRQALQEVGYNEQGEQIASFLDLVKAGEADITEFADYGATKAELREVAKYLADVGMVAAGVRSPLILVKDAFAQMLEPIKRLFAPIGKLLNRLKQVIQYRVLRSIVTGAASAVKQGFTNLEQWDRKEGNTGFAQSMDTARASLEALKNSLAVVAAPFLEYLVTILEKVARWFMKVANSASRLIAIFSGKSTYRTVEWADYSAKATDDYGHSLGKATNKAKEFKRQLMGFDEINNLTDQSGNGTGSGGGGGAAKGGFNFKDMFGEETVGELSDFEKKIAEIGEKVRKALSDLGKWWADTKKNLKQWWNNAKKNISQWWDGIKEKFDNPITWAPDWLLSLLGFGVIRSNKRDSIHLPKEKKERPYGGTIEDLKKLRKEGRRTINLLNDGWITTRDQLGYVRGDLEETSDTFRTKLGESASNAFGKVETSATTASDTLKNRFASSVKDSGLAIENHIGKKGESSFNTFNTSITKTSTALKNNIIDPLGKVSMAIDNAFGKKIGVEFSKSLKGGKQDLDNLTSGVDTFKSKMEQSFGKTWHMKVQGKLELEAIDIFKDYDMIGHLEHKADGGFVNKGQLFVAREAGAEMVGQIGGHTAVANNADIVAAVSSGVASAVASVLGNGNTNVEVVLEGDARGLFRVVQQQAKNYAVQTGKYAFG